MCIRDSINAEYMGTSKYPPCDPIPLSPEEDDEEEPQIRQERLNSEVTMPSPSLRGLIALQRAVDGVVRRKKSLAVELPSLTESESRKRINSLLPPTIASKAQKRVDRTTEFPERKIKKRGTVDLSKKNKITVKYPQANKTRQSCNQLQFTIYPDKFGCRTEEKRFTYYQR
eukprot:TRINITY_DN23122_c0_g1_i1.p1 TRINITY_DN23122_c0_g1~~TRINITY_DN23122_c0_g1_i1.p1  ORF type:complete len:171 (+),score=17.32 TRINITY_DN23122_c0_g1_i1:145-657(+)